MVNIINVYPYNEKYLRELEGGLTDRQTEFTNTFQLGWKFFFKFISHLNIYILKTDWELSHNYLHS